MFADLFYILVDKSSKKPFNFLRIQFERFGFFFVKTVLLLESSFKDNQPKKGNEMTPDTTDPRFTLVQGRNTYTGTGQTTT